jgi:hypothetical protein
VSLKTQLSARPWGRFLIGLFLAFNLGMLIWFVQTDSYSQRQACRDAVEPILGISAHCERESDFSNQKLTPFWLVGDGIFLAVFFAAHAALQPNPGDDKKPRLD